MDARSDLFSLAIILYEMATGARPFKAGTPAEVMSSILRDTPTAPETLRPGLPGRLSSAIQHGLEKDPERRTQSAEDLHRELECAGAAHFALAFLGVAPTEVEMLKAKEAAHKAIDLDPNLGEAYGVAAIVSLYLDWDWPAASSAFDKALALAPNDAFARHGYADYLTVMGRPEEGLEQVLLGRSYDPMSPLANIPVLGHLFALARYDEMLSELKDVRELFPGMPLFEEWTGDALWQLGRYDEALVEYKKAWGGDSETALAMEKALAESGPEAAMRARAELAESSPRADAMAMAELWAEAGEPDKAFEWLEQAYRQRSPRILHVAIWPEYETLHSDPRFDDLLRRIGFPE